MKPGKKGYLAYLSLVTLSGAVVTAFSAYGILKSGVSYQWMILAYLTVLTGAFAIKIPGVNSKLSAADTLIFVNIALFGTAAGVLTAALDGCLASVRFETPARRRRATPFNTAAMGLSAFIAGEVFFRELGRKPLSQEPSLGILELVLPIALSGLVYYLCNSALVAGIVSLDSGGNMVLIWREYFLRISLVSWVSAAAGALIAYCIRSITPLTLVFVVPILVVFYLVDRIYLGPEKGEPIAADNDPVTRRPAYRCYHYFVVTLGLGFIAFLLIEVFRDRISNEWLMLALLTVCAGLVTVRLPGIKTKITLGDIFVFANIIIFGPLVGGITAALDGLAGSLRCASKARRMEFTLFNMAAMAFSACTAGMIFFRILGHDPLYQAEKVAIGALFLPALSLAVSYHVLNALSVATIVALEAETPILRIWRENLLWGMTTYVACALGAVFIAAGIRAVTPAIAIAVLLFLAAVYITCKAFAGRMSPKAQPR